MSTPALDSRSLIIEREMLHPVGKVWRALTQGPLIEEWLLANDFKPIVGHRFNLRTTPMAHWNGVVDCEVLTVEPHTKLSYSWNVGDEATTGFKTVVTWTLTATKSGVLVRMEQSGFRPDQEANYRGASYGWQKFLGNLDKVVGGLA